MRYKGRLLTDITGRYPPRHIHVETWMKKHHPAPAQFWKFIGELPLEAITAHQVTYKGGLPPSKPRPAGDLKRKQVSSSPDRYHNGASGAPLRRVYGN